MSSHAHGPARPFRRVVTIGSALLLAVILGVWAVVGARLLAEVREQSRIDLQGLASLRALADARSDVEAVRVSEGDATAQSYTIRSIYSTVDSALGQPGQADELDVIRRALDDLIAGVDAELLESDRSLVLDEFDLRLEQLVRLQSEAVRNQQAATEQSLVDGLMLGIALTTAVVVAFMIVGGLALVRSRKAESALVDSEQQWKTTFDAAPTGVFLIDMGTGALSASNRAGQVMLGSTEDELAGLDITDIVHPDDVPRVRRRFSTLLASRVDAIEESVRYRARDGREGHALIAAALVKDSAGASRRAVAHVLDVTHRVDAERRLRNLVASKDELIASVSHELRTPLTAVVGYAEMLCDQGSALTELERSEAIESISSEAKDLANIVEDLLVAARADSGSLVVSKTPVDLRREAEQVVTAHVRGDQCAPIEIVGPGARAMGDPARVRQIVRNLVTNALRYGGGHIRVILGQRDGRASLAVADDGAGVPAESEQLIFESYGRAHDRHGMTASIGLGLTVSRLLARRMGGDLTYRKANGETIFELDLPADHGDGSPATPGRAVIDRRPGARGEPARVSASEDYATTESR